LRTETLSDWISVVKPGGVLEAAGGNLKLRVAQGAQLECGWQEATCAEPVVVHSLGAIDTRGVHEVGLACVGCYSATQPS
jgi:hypothetical protein